MSRCWLDSMNIAQVCLRLPTIKGHSEICSLITQHNATDAAKPVSICRCCIRRSRASQTCSMGDMFSEYAGHARTGMFTASRNCVQILAIWGRALSCYKTRLWSLLKGTTMVLRISTPYLRAFKIPTIKCSCVYCSQPHHHHGPINPQRLRQETAHPHDATQAVCHVPWKVKTSVNRTPLQCTRRHQMSVFALSSWLKRQTAVRSRPWWGPRACR